MKEFAIEFAFDDESGTYTCYAPSLATAIDSFSAMVEQLSVPIDIIRAFEVTNGQQASGTNRSDDQRTVQPH